MKRMYDNTGESRCLEPLRQRRLAKAVTDCLQPRPTPLACALGLGAALVAVAPLHAATYTVYNTMDAGPGSLRQALSASEAHSGPDQIVFASSVSGTIVLTSGPLEKTTYDSLSIVGPGKEKLVIDGNGNDAILTAVIQDDSSFAVSGVTLQHAGRAVSLRFSGYYGSAVIEDSIITGTTEVGIETSTYWSYSSGDVRLHSVRISGNSGNGTDLYGNIVIIDSVITDNGGIGIRTGTGYRSAAAPLSVKGSVVARNGGGGIRQPGCWGARVDVSDTQVIDNGGVGVLAQGSLSVARSTVSGNAGAGIEAKLSLTDSTVSGNMGGGIRARAFSCQDSTMGIATVQVVNSTISGNEGPISGGGIYQLTGSTIIVNSVITGNKAQVGGGVFKTFQNEEWQYNAYYEPTMIRNSIIAGNQAPIDPDIKCGLASEQAFILPAELHYSLIGDLGDAYTVESVPGSNLFGLDPLLGPLQDNGGPTLTHALLTGSPAIDRGDPESQPSGWDQRGEGFDRIVNERIDIGAFEVQSPVTGAVGVWRPTTRQFLLDANGNGTWDGAAAGDTLTAAFGASSDRPVIGDWNGDGSDDVGVWRPSDRRFRLDGNGNAVWDGPTGGDTTTVAFGASADQPVAGDWNGDGKDEVGVWRPSTRQFMLDANGNGRWDAAAGGDTLSAAFGVSTDRPVIGDWDGDGKDEVGVWRPSTRRFMLDTNGNGSWDGTAALDTLTGAFGASTDRPVIGDWNGDGKDDVGVGRPSDGKFRLDANGTGLWEGPAGGDVTTGAFGVATDIPVAGIW
jgi:hypothetical protein